MQHFYKKGRGFLFFLMKIVDPISLCPNVFHKIETVLMYIALHQTIETRRGSCMQTIVHEKRDTAFVFLLHLWSQ